MPRPSLARLAQRPGLLGALLFVATMGLAAALAYQAARAASSHRKAAEAALAHHAAIAAWRFAREGRSWVSWGMDQASGPLNQEAARSAALPGPDLFDRVLAEKECDCMSAGFARTLFRVVVARHPKLDITGEPLSERAKDSLVTLSILAAADTAERPGGVHRWHILPPGTPRLNRATDIVLLWKIGDRQRGVRAMYGMIVESAQIERPLKGALKETQFFPASLIPDSIARSLVRFEVAGSNASNILSVGPDTRAYIGRDTLGNNLGELIVTAAIDPRAAPYLAGGLPTSRATTIVAMLVLALALGGGALLLLRREYRLARLREDFVSGVSHELRTPLTQIRMLSELLESEGFKNDAERTRATGVIHREALRLTNLVDNILEFSRLRRLAPAPAKARVALADVAREIAESFAPMLGAKTNTLTLHLAEGIEVPADRDAVSRVLRNLVENAIKYGPAGQTIRVSLTHVAASGTALMTVDDEGPGIPRDEWTRIWQPYYRLDRDRNAPVGGSGLGLSVVADLMRQLGGRAWVADAPTRGARFTVEFPGATANEPAAS